MRVLDDFVCKDCGLMEEKLYDNTAVGDVVFCKCGGIMQKQMSFNQNFRFYGDGTYVQHQKGD